MVNWMDRASVVVTSLVIDQILGELPTVAHPIALYGSLMGFVEEVLWSDTVGGGFRYLGVGLLAPVALGALARKKTLQVALTYLAVARRSLIAHGLDVKAALDNGDLVEARIRLAKIVGRDTKCLSESDISRATIESLAENFNDAVGASIIYANFVGPSAVAIHRCVNTLDAIVGRRSQTYLNFGAPAARLDDLLGYIPARVCAFSIALCADRQPLKVFLRSWMEARPHPSPNAGLMEAAMANVLGIELGGSVDYGSEHSVRPIFGPNVASTPSDIQRAVTVLDQALVRLVLGMVALDFVLAILQSLRSKSSVKTKVSR